MTNIEEWRDYIKLALQYYELSEKLKTLEAKYDEETNRLMAEAWMTFADGKKWEKEENYYVGCLDCRRRMFDTILEKLNMNIRTEREKFRIPQSKIEKLAKHLTPSVPPNYSVHNSVSLPPTQPPILALAKDEAEWRINEAVALITTLGGQIIWNDEEP